MWNILRMIQKSYLFKKIGDEVRKNMESVCLNTVILKREKRTGRWIVTRCKGKMKSFETWPKKDPQCAKHAIFATRVSHKQVTKASRQKPLWQNFEKLSKCFSQLKIHPQGSREGSRKSFWVYLARNLKIQIFENFSKSFSQLGHWPARESWKPSV